ncbi:hypothetical protein BKA61DRAFT_578962 [Leptodontidium sp. MPI-SDFR-AT-0119]|nr:hypothetical protein BKA61DRAFT_578962 [Leptodontidium sp. MPI-SDFR-AT-0119]
MRSFEQSFSDPVLTLPAQHPHQSSFNMDSNRPKFTAPFTNGTNGIHQSPATSSWSTLMPTQSTPRSAAGRKRSRDEAASNLEEDYFQVPVPVLPEPENEDEWEYGEGMVLIKKGTGYITDSTSQTGTWQEEKAAEEQAKLAALVAAAADRPILRANKSQRLNLSATPAIPEEQPAINGEAASPGSPERHHEPTVDAFTLHLGIGWSSMDNAGPDIQAAARGWAKFIENHFPVTNAKIQLQSKGLSSYLVEANEGYFLFGEDLKQGRLVSTSLEKTFANLREPTPVFDGDVVMEAGQTPKADAAQSMVVDESAMNGLQVVGLANGINPPLNGGDMMIGTDSPIIDGLTSGINAPVVNGEQAMNGMANGTDERHLNGTHQPPQTVEVEMDMS